jgi:hypothetical protein
VATIRAKGAATFPPPQPWKQLAAIDPDQEYLAFTSRFALRSFLRAPAFLGASLGIMKQVEAAPGAVGNSLGSHLPGMSFDTLSVWQDDESLRAPTNNAKLHRPPDTGFFQIVTSA